MHRAVIAAAGTVVGLVALLGYKSSSGTIKSSPVAVQSPSTPSAPSSSTTQPPSTTPPAAGTQTTPPTSTPSTTTTFTGNDVQYQYGDIQIRITMRGGKITNIATPQESATDSRSQSINSQAVPILTQEALTAQSMQFDVVSGATFTSDAFAQSLQSALTKVGK
ncbi:MAG: hypothetical protein QOJ44_1249 [Acidimicrobiaceae bacterium]|jgi:uncharacterized protein with FMN-binding domain|nr:hypothetical protein [Acidimicrobiaceae bacterium]